MRRKAAAALGIMGNIRRLLLIISALQRLKPAEQACLALPARWSPS
jgi:hypothetical protein